MKYLLSILGLGLFAGAAFADVVIKTQPKNKLVAISFSEEKQFRPDEEVCLKVGEISIACGDIFKTGNKGVLVYLYYGMENITPGRQVEVVSRRAAPRSRLLVVGANMKSPRVEFQQLFNSNVSYGILTEALIIRNGSLAIKGFAPMMTVSVYSSGVFRGLWLMAGLGIHFANLQNSDGTGQDSITSMIGHGSLGWRFRISDFSFALAAGAQYFLDKNLHPTVKNNGILPIGMIDIGYVF